MTWETFYLACFAIGLVFCVLSVFTGGHGHFHFGHAHVPHLHAPHVHAHTPHVASPRVPLVNVFTITAFLCWFGGTGYLLRTHNVFYAPLILLVSTISGLAGAGFIFWFLASVLMPHERELTAEETAVTGVIGQVTGPLYAGATGEIVYSQLGARRSAPARSEDGAAIERGAEVIVLRYERGVAYVRPWNDMEP